MEAQGGMKTLLLMRHAKSCWKDPDLSDHDRPLNKRGKHAAPFMGAYLRDHGQTPDAILSSTAKRGRATAKRVKKAGDFDAEIELRDELYMADARDYLRVLHTVSDTIDCVLVVGHNPGIEAFAEYLTGEPATMPTAAVAVVDVPVEHWKALGRLPRSTLRQVWRPKELETAG